MDGPLAICLHVFTSFRLPLVLNGTYEQKCTFCVFVHIFLNGKYFVSLKRNVSEISCDLVVTFKTVGPF